MTAPAARRRLARSAVAATAVLVLAAALSACGVAAADRPGAVTIGFLYPHDLSQGPQGLEEQRGAALAVEWANAHGGVRGDPIRVVSAAADRPEAVPEAIDGLQRGGASIIVGSHGSTISAVAAAEASRRHLLLWETGAIGQTDASVAAGEDFIRMAPMGANLGKAAVDFVRDALAAKLTAAGHNGPYRWAVANVDDAYGRAVADGATAEIGATGQPLAGTFSYRLAGFDATVLATRIAAVHPDILFVSAYMADGVGLRQALIARHVPLVASLGTSSSFCMPEFGAALGAGAFGLFASDKPDAAAVRPDALSAEGRETLAWASVQYQARFHVAMSSHALSGFSNAYALFVHVLPATAVPTPHAVAVAAMAVKLPVGTLANGGGLDIAPLGAPDAGNNRNAAGVIWEWVGPGQRAVVWPPAFATHAVLAVPLES